MKTRTIKRALTIVCSLATGLPSVLWGYESVGQLSCLIEPSARIRVSSQSPGIVQSVNKERGDSVQKGELLLALENSLEAAQLKAAKIRKGYSSRQQERNDEIYEKGFLSEARRDEIETEKALGDVAVEEASARLNRKTVYSPINGVVVSRMVSIGEFVENDALLELAALHPLYAEVLIQADKYQQVRKGMSVQVAVDGTEQVHSGKVVIVDRVIDPSSATFGIRVSLDNQDLSIPAGVNCQVSFNSDEPVNGKAGEELSSNY
ncbi:MAG: efflux RND transporter periplasmic adaptor subunit [Endozoicomonas sp.]